MDDDVVIGGRHLHWSYRLTGEEMLGPLPELRSKDVAAVRNRGRKIGGKVSVPRALDALLPRTTPVGKSG